MAPAPRPSRRWLGSRNDDLLDLRRVAATLHLAGGPPTSTCRSRPGATGCCPASPGCPSRSSTAIVERFGDLQKILRATIDELDEVDGVGETRAQAIKDGLARIAEASILDRYS